jgi:pantoate--beta-alanine ligase
MRTVTTIAELRAALAQARREERSIGLVPTMGALHEGHLSLIRRARQECELVVMSLFVNPAQFNDGGDLAAYPSDRRRDAQLAAEAGVDHLFAPTAQEIYPPGFATQVSVAGITETLEGRHRGRGHFDGVTTVVTKLLNIVAPQVAYFGAKDAQQAVVVRRLVHDLDIPVRIELCPTVRDVDGLALSSRNVRLSPAERRRATALHRALGFVKDAVLEGERDPAAAIAPPPPPRRGRAGPRRDRTRLPGAGRRRHAQAGEAGRPRRDGGGRGLGRIHATDRQHPDPSALDHRSGARFRGGGGKPI